MSVTIANKLPTDNQTPGNRRRGGNFKLFVFAVLLLVAVIAWWQLANFLNIDSLIGAETWLRNEATERPVWSAMVAFLVYVGVTGLSLPFALVLSLTISWLLGFGWSIFVISFGSTIGATLAMLASRYVLRDFVREKFGKRFSVVLSKMDREGKWYLASLRLAPPVPFFAVNLLAGLTRIGVLNYFWISQLCMLPATAIFCWVGASLPGLEQLSRQGPGTLVSRSLIFGLCGVAFLPFVIRFLLRRNRRRNTADFSGN